MEDPRIARTRATVLETAADIVVERGPSALTVDAVVVRSGVARSTIYRHWPTRDDLLLAVFNFCAPNPAQPDDGLGFEAALREFLYDLIEQFRDPKWARMLPALLALKSYEPTIAEVDEHLDEKRHAVIENLFSRGVREGLMSPDTDHPTAIAQLIGPLMFAVITGAPELSTELADHSLRCFLAGLPT